jgi:predicted ribosomally synthesized peptide with nif11-like leader
MAAASAKDLIKKMTSDAAFRQSLEAASTKEARKAILAKAGFGDVTKDDVRAVAKAEGTELTDADLESVAGGRISRGGGGHGVTSPIEWATVLVAAAALI